jgi:uncharacterized membrane protein YfcA
VLAGISGTTGGITTLVSYPALLIVGLSPLAATLTNTVAIVTALPGALLGSRPELAGTASWLKRWAIVAVLGGAAGGALLLATPSTTFKWIVPVLVLAGVVALVLEPRIKRGGEQSPSRHRLQLGGWLLVISFYGGYFGAGSGVMALTVILILVDRRLVYANALKNVLTYAAVIPAAILFAATGRVHWAAAWPLALGVLIGARLGPSLARTLPSAILRAAIAACGLALTVVLAIQAF